MLERLLFLLILINTSVDYAACVRLFRNIIFLLHVSKQRRNPAVSLETVSLFSLVRFWFPVICRILVLLPKAANRGTYYTNSRTLYVCVREANNMRIRKEKSARKRVCVCACIGVCVCVKQRQTVCVCLGSSAARLQISSISLSQAQGLLGKWQTAPWLWQQRLHPNFPTENAWKKLRLSSLTAQYGKPLTPRSGNKARSSARATVGCESHRLPSSCSRNSEQKRSAWTRLSEALRACRGTAERGEEHGPALKVYLMRSSHYWQILDDSAVI